MNVSLPHIQHDVFRSDNWPKVYGDGTEQSGWTRPYTTNDYHYCPQLKYTIDYAGYFIIAIQTGLNLPFEPQLDVELVGMSYRYNCGTLDKSRQYYFKTQPFLVFAGQEIRVEPRSTLAYNNADAAIKQDWYGLWHQPADQYGVEQYILRFSAYVLATE